MNNNLLVAPSILSADFSKMGQAVKDLEDWGADWVHCDVMDGVYVPNITFGMPMVAALRKNTTLPLDVHLMISKPEKYIQRFLDAGADIITFHADACESQEKVIEMLHLVRAHGKKVGLVLSPNIDISTIENYLQNLDLVMLMGVYPGFGGQQFISTVMDKLAMLKSMIGDRNVLIELDGGVTLDNVSEMAKNGLDIAVGGNCIFGAVNPKMAIEQIKNINNSKK